MAWRITILKSIDQKCFFCFLKILKHGQREGKAGEKDLNDFNIISIFEPTETILPLELYESFNSHLILIFADIRKNIEDTNLSLNEKEELSNLEIQNKDFEILKDYKTGKEYLYRDGIIINRETGEQIGKN